MLKTLILLNCLVLAMSATVASAQCDLSPWMENVVTVTEGDLVIIFATDKDFYEVYSEDIHIDSIIRNTGTEPVVLSWPVGSPDAIFITPTDCGDIVECADEHAFSYPFQIDGGPGEMIIEPGECRSWSMIIEAPLPLDDLGDYLLWGGVFAWSTEQSGPIGAWVLPSNGAAVEIHVDMVVPTANMTFDGVKSLYR